MKREIGISYEIAKRMMMKSERIYPPLYCICVKGTHPDCRCIAPGFDYVRADFHRQLNETKLN